MPEDGIPWMERTEILRLEEVIQLGGLFARLGVRKFRLTGGEPTVRKGYLHVVEALAQLGQTYMTTNGTMLANHAQPLKAAGIAGLNVSLDSLRRDRFEAITRRDALADVLAGIDAALAEGIPLKINVVAMPGVNDDELVDFVDWAKDRPLEVRFIEFMPFLGNGWKSEKVLGYAEMRQAIEGRFELEPLPGAPTDVAKEFAIVGHRGTVGFVTSVTDSFCGECNRIRLTSDGRFKTCLFLPPQTSLRDLLRSGADEATLVEAIRNDLNTKWAAHPPMQNWKQRDTLSMVQIGG
jgi:cyclic pyranopterin phosphate synthase